MYKGDVLRSSHHQPFWWARVEEGLERFFRGLGGVLDASEQAEGLLQVAEGLVGDGLVVGGHQAAVPQVDPQIVPGLGRGVGLDIHGASGGYMVAK
jgi:hypothetical protein